MSFETRPPKLALSMGYEQEKIKPYNGQEEKHVLITHMFDNIAHSYDVLNHALSLGIDKIWRRRAINRLKKAQPHTLLDIATGTGDLAIQACRAMPTLQVTATDISTGMMQVGEKKVAELGLTSRIRFEVADCTALPYQDNTYDAITAAFGIRNFEDLDAGLKEMWRVLKPGGRVVLLELSEPQCFPMKQGFYVYSKWWMPFIGGLMSKDKGAYSYLTQSIKAFPQGEVLRESLLHLGFSEVWFERLSGGLCTHVVAIK